MITRVEVTLEGDTPQDRNRGIRCKEVVTFDEREEKTEHPDLVNHQEYDSRHLLVQEISRKLGVEDEIIEIIDEATLTDDADTKEEEIYKNGSLYPYEMPGEVDIREDKFSIFEWLRKLKKGQLLLNPEFQRHLVWKDDQRSEVQIYRINTSKYSTPTYVCKTGYRWKVYHRGWAAAYLDSSRLCPGEI